MKLIEHIIEPKKLVILWQAIDGGLGKATGERFVVGEISNNGSNSTLTYFDSEDTKKAIAKGFKGFTAYPFEANKIYSDTVEGVLAKRLPPDSRGDYEDFLRAYRISPKAAKNASALALLAHTAGSLMGDGFSFYPVYDESEPPTSFTFEIAGFRYNGLKHCPDPRVLKGGQVSLLPDDANQFDSQAVSVAYDGKVLGYVPKGLNTSARALLRHYTLMANIERINGTLERPYILVFAEVTKQ